MVTHTVDKHTFRQTIIFSKPVRYRNYTFGKNVSVISAVKSQYLTSVSTLPVKYGMSKATGKKSAARPREIVIFDTGV